jgi:sugar lactone lactonase YvrE
MIHPPRSLRPFGHAGNDRGSRPVTVRFTPWSSEPGQLSGGPRWHEERQELLWVDILGKQVHRGQGRGGGALEVLTTLYLDRHVGAVAPAEEGGYVVAAGQGYVYIAPNGSVRDLAQPEAGNDAVGMNDGACDRQGRFWAGSRPGSTRSRWRSSGR